MSSALRWCFTSYDAGLKDRLSQAYCESNAISYVVFQQESCPSSGRLHWQGYLVSASRKRFSTVKKFLGDPAVHLAVARGSTADNIAYCTKDESRSPHPGAGPFRIGNPPSGSEEEKSSGLDNAIGLLRDGGRLRDLVQSDPKSYVRYFRGLSALSAAQCAPQGNTYKPVATYAYWGPAGCGKTRSVMEWAASKGVEVYWKVYTKNGPSWWDGYDNQPVIFIDDFEGERSGCDVTEFLHLNHGYGHLRQWPVKGGFIWLSGYTTVIYTSNTNPLTWFSDVGKCDAVARRIHVNLPMRSQGDFQAPVLGLHDIPSPSVHGSGVPPIGMADNAYESPPSVRQDEQSHDELPLLPCVPWPLELLSSFSGDHLGRL